MSVFDKLKNVNGTIHVFVSCLIYKLIARLNKIVVRD